MPRPSLRFSPYAWAKLLFLRDRGETEIGGFGLSAEDDPLLVVDILTVRQRCTPITVAFDDRAVADLFDDLVDEGLTPERFARSDSYHPGSCPFPSSTDETTFRRVFGRNDWSVMAIVAQNDATYARLSFHAGPGGALEIPVRVDYGQPFDGRIGSRGNRRTSKTCRRNGSPPPAPPMGGLPESDGRTIPGTLELGGISMTARRVPDRFERQQELVPRERICERSSR